MATGTRDFGSKGRDTSESNDDYDIPLIKRFCTRKERTTVVSSPAAMEEDSVDECLHGTSVVDPLIPEQTSDSAILAPDPVTQDDAPAVHLQEAISSPLPEPVSSLERADHDPPQDPSTLPLPFRLGQTIYHPPSRRKIFLPCYLQLRF